MADNNQHNEKIADKLARKTISSERFRCLDVTGNRLPFNSEDACTFGGGHWLAGHEKIRGQQKIIKDGNVTAGRESNDDRIVMYGSDLLAHSEDIDNILDGTLTESDLESPTLSSLETADKISNPENVSQFVDFDPHQLSIDPELADEILDTDITELLPEQTTRQQEINEFFDEFSRLVGDVPDFTEDELGDLELNELDPNWSDISINPQDPNASITRLQDDEDENNVNQSLESLRDVISDYLQDVDSEGSVESDDDRPDYEDTSSGFVKIRGLNQSILIKQEEGRELSLSKMISDPITGIMTPRYLVEGFTITMWVRFKDKVNGGTLFNFGNPVRSFEPHGFRLETFVLEDGEVELPNDSFTFEDGTIPFSQETHERFVRLVVREDASTLRDSHVGLPHSQRVEGVASDSTLYNCTRIPIDLDEWYFIVANYNPSIVEDDSFTISDGNLGVVTEIPEFWRWNVVSDLSGYIHFSQHGAKCKVEIISKSDLLRARGYNSLST